MLAAVRIRGIAGNPERVERALHNMGLDKRCSCILAPDTESYRGMFNAVSEAVTWGEIDEDTVDMLTDTGKESVEGTVFRLSPPEGGFKKSVKETYPKGAMGNRGEKMNQLIQRMVRENG